MSDEALHQAAIVALVRRCADAVATALSTHQAAPVPDLQWLLVRCHDTLAYRGQLQVASYYALIESVGEFDREFAGILPADLVAELR